ncbi:MAG TPA: hypothetical protein VFL51_13990 [Pseudolabrys sp.]|nr:hypothetical protein [Pseudolabrys sp.]
MPHIGNAVLDWLTADFQAFGLTGQNWMLALTGGAAAIFLILALVAHICEKPTRRIP